MSMTIRTRLVLVHNGPSLPCLETAMNHPGWRWTPALSAVDALQLVRTDATLDAIVAVVTPESFSHIVELCRCVKLDSRWNHISILCLLTLPCDRDAISFYRAGIDDCIRSYVGPDELALRIERALQTHRTMELLDDSHRIIQALANAVEGKDHYTCGHVDRVSAFSVELGRRLGLDEVELKALKLGGAVHDIGKIGVPDEILNKQSRLTDKEYAIMKRHPLIGHDILKPMRTFADVIPIVRWHHEKPNGRGYPDGLKGEEIPITARIVAVADVFDALATDRTYRAAIPVPNCCAMMLAMGRDGDLDLDIVRVMCQVLGQDDAVAA